MRGRPNPAIAAGGRGLERKGMAMRLVNRSNVKSRTYRSRYRQG
jgi:hypothetical protein